MKNTPSHGPDCIVTTAKYLTTPNSQEVVCFEWQTEMQTTVACQCGGLYCMGNDFLPGFCPVELLFTLRAKRDIKINDETQEIITHRK